MRLFADDVFIFSLMLDRGTVHDPFKGRSQFHNVTQKS